MAFSTRSAPRQTVGVTRARQGRLGRNIRLIALTGYGQPEDRDRAYAAGFDEHRVKPVDRDLLARSVGQHGN